MKIAHRYPAGTRETLFVLSRGQCYAPKCGAPVVQCRKGQWRTNAHIAHICGLNETSARYDDPMPVPERNHFRNLLLLCKPDHDIVDSKANERIYTKERLIEWKKEREGDLAGSLLDLGAVTEDTLRDWITGAVADTREEFASAFDRMEIAGGEILASLKQAALEFFDLPYLDKEDIRSLHFTALVFQRIPEYAILLQDSGRMLNHLPDTTDQLTSTAFRLGGLPNTTDLLDSVASRLSGLGDSADILSMVARDLREARIGEFAERAADIRWSVDELTRASDQLGEVRQSITPLADAAAAIEESADRLERAAQAVHPGGWSWRAFWWGTGVCALVVVIVLSLWAYVLTHK